MSCSLLVPGRNCWRIERAQRLGFLIDGAAYFAAVRAAIARAKRSVFILGWDFDSRVRLVPQPDDGYPAELGEFLKEVVRRSRGLRMYVLSWDFAMAFALDREWVPLYKLGWRTHPAPRLSFRLDDRHPPGGSHHQKVVVVDDALAFAGGLDLTHGRWDTPEHRREEPNRLDAQGRIGRPNHDVQAIVDGAAARALGELARDRWRRATGRGCVPLERPPASDPWPAGLAPELTDAGVAISRTDPGWVNGQPVEEIRSRKDPFFFYKANWSLEPVTYITSRRYTDRAYALTNVKVYSNADSVRLSVNGRTFAAKKAHECPMATCVFKDVRLARGENVVEAEGRHGDKRVTDAVRWSLNTDEVNIAAGWVATGYVSRDGRRFGSDNFFLGGKGEIVESGKKEEKLGPESLVSAGATRAADTAEPSLYRHFRSGTFAYDIPLENGRYQVTLGFVEPDLKAAAGQRVFDVLANGKPVLEGFEALKAAGGAHQSPVTHSFPVQVSNGRLMLDFKPARGEAVVSVIAIRKEPR